MQCICFALEEGALKGSRLQVKAIISHISRVHITPDTPHLTVVQYARAVALLLLGGTMCPDSSGNLVSLLYLAKLEDIVAARNYSWGSVVLSFLYRELCNASEKGKAAIGGALQLVQSLRLARHLLGVPILTGHLVSAALNESSKIKWKVLCKDSTEEQWCRWELRGHVKCNPSYGIKHIIQNVKDQIGHDVPYQKAWYSLKMAREIVYGTWESSVQKLPKYLGAIQEYNPGTIVEWKHKGFQQTTDKYVMGYVFWAFKPCIDGFQFCRKIISVDATHLYTKYKYKLLIATAMDENQQVLPLAFAVVDEETYPSWKWFLQQLSRHVIIRRRGMCLISDRYGGLIKAVREGPDFVSPHGVHRYCLRHVCSNFNSSIKNVVFKDLCWQAGSEYQLRKFNRIMEEIKKQSVTAFAYLDQINMEKWTASHDGGWRCGILTTNMSECINGVLKGARRLPSASVVIRRQNRHGMNTHVVKIANRECSCGKWNQFGIPCSHAQKVCGAYNISAASIVKDYYDLMAYNNTYSKHFEPVQSEDYWDDPNFQLVQDPTIRTVTRPDRNQTTRIHNEMDWRQTRARQEAQQQQEDSSIQENVS
ncbi:UNVERIFIED_CONTAM: hypothetical protein Sradi_4217000 [Sesamum radiatum]|uniref:SWIM-type domain-containing protein n=1 Tax=Sesamum radiatum TaxID=300843 RepID=A0AAW2P6R3_SESRA